jgi:hypothetical protein
MNWYILVLLAVSILIVVRVTLIVMYRIRYLGRI